MRPSSSPAMTHVTGGSPINRTSRPRQSVSPARQTQTQLSSSQSQDHDLIVGGVTLIRPREEMKKKYYQRALDKAQIIGAIGTLKLCKDLIHTLIPHTQRFSKKSASTSSTDPCCAYYKLIQGVSDLYELSVQENNSTLPPVSAKWSRDLIIGFVKLEAAIRPSKDKRVSYLGSALDIGAVNTLKVCKNFILAALPKLQKGFESFRYQRVATAKTGEKYG